MKVLTDFVTNSSSSSFVLAVRKSVLKDKEKLLKALSKADGSIKDFLETLQEYAPYSLEERDIVDVNQLKEALARDITSEKGLELGAWVVIGGEGSSDGMYAGIMSLLYNHYPKFDEKEIKYKSYN